MNLIRRVWLPPDGDSRLVRFQETLARVAARLELAAVPPFVHLDSSVRDPAGPVEAGPWRLDRDQPVLDALDAEGLIGVFRFGLPSRQGWSEEDLALLPPPPVWKWTRGRLAVMELTLPQGDAWVALWSWKILSGWRSERPRG